MLTPHAGKATPSRNFLPVMRYSESCVHKDITAKFASINQPSALCIIIFVSCNEIIPSHESIRT